MIPLKGAPCSNVHISIPSRCSEGGEKYFWIGLHPLFPLTVISDTATNSIGSIRKVSTEFSGFSTLNISWHCSGTATTTTTLLESVASSPASLPPSSSSPPHPSVFPSEYWDTFKILNQILSLHRSQSPRNADTRLTLTTGMASTHTPLPADTRTPPPRTLPAQSHLTAFALPRPITLAIGNGGSTHKRTEAWAVLTVLDSEVRVGLRQCPEKTAPTYTGPIPAAAAITVWTVWSREDPRSRSSRALPPPRLFAVGTRLHPRFPSSVTSQTNHSSHASAPGVLPKADKMSAVRKTPEVTLRRLPHVRKRPQQFLHRAAQRFLGNVVLPGL